MARAAVRPRALSRIFVLEFGSLIAISFCCLFDISAAEITSAIVGPAILFTIGKSLIGWYIGSSAVASSFGAAGGLIALLLWVYYSAQIFLLGAEFTKVYANRHGSKRGKNGVVLDVQAMTLHPTARGRPTCGSLHLEILRRGLLVCTSSYWTADLVEGRQAGPLYAEIRTKMSLPPPCG